MDTNLVNDENKTTIETTKLPDSTIATTIETTKLPDSTIAKKMYMNGVPIVEIAKALGINLTEKPKNRSAIARTLYTHGIPIAEIAKALGITYQTVYVNTKGREKTKKRQMKYRAIRLAKGKRKHTMTSISKKTGIARSTLADMLKRMGLKNKQNTKVS